MFFFNVEKQNRSNNYITKLKADNRTLVSPTEIVKEEHRYYQNLYTSTCTNANDTCYDKFFDRLSLPKLSAQLADTSDGRLTKEECHASLKEFSRGKSPVMDGLTAEFYLKFWEQLGQELVAFEMGELSISQKRGIITLIPKKDKYKVLLDTVVIRLYGARFFQEKSVFGWQVSAKIGVRLIAKYFCTTKS